MKPSVKYLIIGSVFAVLTFAAVLVLWPWDGGSDAVTLEADRVRGVSSGELLRSGETEPEFEFDPDETVYVTESGSKFHRAGCRYQNENCRDMKASEAYDMGYRPCSYCFDKKETDDG